MQHGDKVEILESKHKGKQATLLSYEPSLDMWWVKFNNGKKLFKAGQLKRIKS